MLPGTTPPGKIRRSNKEAQGVSTFQTSPPILPTITGCSGIPSDVHNEYPHFLISFEVYGIVLHNLESRDHYAHFTDREQRPEET